MENSYKPEFNIPENSTLRNPELQSELRELDQKCNKAIELLDGSNQGVIDKIEDYRRKQREAVIAKYEVPVLLLED